MDPLLPDADIEANLRDTKLEINRYRNVSSRRALMMFFTVLGYWPDSLQRFSAHVSALSPDEAEEVCTIQYPGIAVCAVLAGHQSCLDTRSLVYSR